MRLDSPYPYFGGKSKVAQVIWQHFGQCKTYIEPFFGSGAVLLANPYWHDTVETVNDINHYIANFWRAIQAAPEEVARYADYPVIETDLHARHIWLVNEGAEIVKRCTWDDEFYDAKVAGYWVWGMALWIGGGFCEGKGVWTRETLQAAEELNTYDIKEIRRRRPDLDNQKGVERPIPSLGNAGRGVQRKSVHRKIPSVIRAGRGINRQIVYLTNRAAGITKESGNRLLDYLLALSERFRRVRVCCGNWARIVKPSVTWETNGAISGIFLDPPYSDPQRYRECYGKYDDGDIAHHVREWCKVHGQHPNLRIALCGYDGEHRELEELGWRVYAWKANGGYATEKNSNRYRERIWFSPHCHFGESDVLFDKST